MSEATLKLGDSLPEDVKFGWIAPSPENADIKACGMPIIYNASKGKQSTHMDEDSSRNFPFLTR